MQALDALMRRFTIQLRMTGAIVMVVALLLAVGTTAMVGMSRTEQLAEGFVNSAFKEAMLSSSLNRHMGNLRRWEKDLIINYENPKEIERYKGLWLETLKETREVLKHLQDGGNTERVAGVKAIATRIDAYQAAFDPVLKQLESGGYDNATAIAKVSMRAQEEVRAADAQLQALMQVIEKEGVDAKASLRASAQRTLTFFAGVLALALALVIPTTLLNARSIVRPLHQARGLAQAIAAGDLTQNVDVHGRDEPADLMRSLQQMQQALRSLVGQLRDASANIGNASSEVAAGNQDLSQRTEEAASSLQQTASSMAQLTGTVKQSAEAASQANQLASSASSVATRGGEVVTQVVSTMEEINTASKKIADIISVIDGIAFQTNILALNAAVEAARAGEQGRGFAVVAGEVRSLAQRSAEAAKEIKTLIGNSVDRVEVGARLVAEAGQTMTEIVSSVQRVTDIMGEITASAAEQSMGIGQVNQAVNQLDQMTQQNAALVEESAAAAESLREQAQRLNSVVATFRVAGSDVAALPLRPTTRLTPADHSTRSPAAPAAPLASAKAVIERVRQQPAPAVSAAAPRSADKPAPVATSAGRDEGEWESF